MSETKRTPGPWVALNMVHAERGGPLTPEELGEYVKNSVLKSAESGGSLDRFLFISTGEDGAPDVCHIGNGPAGPANAAFIVEACNAHDELRVEAERMGEIERAARLIYDDGGAHHDKNVSALRRALAVAKVKP